MDLSKKKEFEKRLASLEEERYAIRKRERILIIVSVILGVGFCTAIFLSQGFDNGSLIMIPLTIIFAYWIHNMVIAIPFRDLTEQFKAMVLKEYFNIFHPKMKYSYSQEAVRGLDIIKDATLAAVDECYEEDVIEGQKNNLEFYISEIQVGGSDSERKFSFGFNGMLFHLKFKDRFFPKSVILSNVSLFTSWFSKYRKNKEFDFHYYSENEELFQKELKYIFPFIQYYKRFNSEIRLYASNNELTLLCSTNMNFLDAPGFSLKKPLFSEKYLEVMTMQLNTLFYIIEAFSENLEKTEIEERIEEIIEGGRVGQISNN